MTLQKLIDDSKSKEDILKLFTKYGWSSGFKSLDFNKLRSKIIPELLALYGSNNTEIASSWFLLKWNSIPNNPRINGKK